MTYASVCDGISACRVAWKPLGWDCRWVSEIDPFCNAVCDHHYPGQANLGDMEKIGDAPGIDLLVGGTPCQSFSVAGLRKGMADPRGNLALVFLRLVDRLRPRWVVWENVPGVLSSNKGRDFGAFLGALVQLGYGWSYRILDAQFVRVDGHERAVPQRRRRVFVVGYLGDWRRAAAVLLERASLCGHPAPRRSAGEGAAGDVAPSLRGGGPGGNRVGDTRGQDPVVAMFLNAGGTGRIDAESETFIAHTQSGEGSDASEDGSGRGTPLVYPINEQVGTRHIALGERTGLGIGESGDPAFTLQRDHPHAIAFAQNQRDEVRLGVRRVTPRECERLQGFPDDYTLVPYRGKPASDAPRYKALGNSMACNVMRWLGRRIEMVEAEASGMIAAAGGGA